MSKVIGSLTENLNETTVHIGSVQPMQEIYVVRDADGRVSGLSATAGEHTEPALIDDPEVQSFMRELDIGLVRVLEDVIELLVSRGVFRFTDLPISAQDKLLFRKNLRSQWRSVPDPLGDEEGLF